MNIPQSTSVPAYEAYRKVCSNVPQHECKSHPSSGISLYSWGLNPVKKVRVPRLNEVTLAVHLGGVRRLRILTEDGISEKFSRPGDISLIPRGQSIEYLIDGPVTFATMHIPTSAVGVFGSNGGGDLMELPHCLFAIRDDFSLSSVRALLHASKIISTETREYTSKVLETLAWHLLLLVSEGKVEPLCLAQEEVKTSRNMMGENFSGVLAEIEKRLDERLNIEELADIAGLGRTAFCEQFTKQFASPPHQFIIERRIKRAKYLLETESKSVTEVAYQLGFSSSSHFSATFKKVVGLTPRGYLSM